MTVRLAAVFANRGQDYGRAPWETNKELNTAHSGRGAMKATVALTRHMKSRSVAVMAGWGFMEWCMTRMAGSRECEIKMNRPPDTGHSSHVY